MEDRAATKDLADREDQGFYDFELGISCNRRKILTLVIEMSNHDNTETVYRNEVVWLNRA